jgi:site-specific DNA-methyltransferase (adenine-specific)
VWLLGRHRLVCEDCRGVLPTLSGIDAVISDPPYGIGYVKGTGGRGPDGSFNRPSASTKRGYNPIAGDDAPFDPAPLLTFGNVLLWGADHYRARLPETGRFLAWDKLAGMEPWDSFSDVEFAWHSAGGASRIFSMKWKGIACEKKGENGGLRLHTTSKPIRLMVWCMEQAGASAKATILDPYAGSGTTIVACEQTGRTCVAVEIEPRYIDVAVLRWQAFTSQEATHADTGRTFTETAEDRAARVPAPQRTRAKAAA